MSLPTWIKGLPFRLGTTSYIIPADIQPNVRYLAGQVRDVELILFELEDGSNNVPDDELLAELRRTGEEYDLSYTVHLPLDLDLGAVGEERIITLHKAQRAIEATISLDPWAYVLHLDSVALQQNRDGSGLAKTNKSTSVWSKRALQALEMLDGWVGKSGRLAVENLDGYPPDFIFPILDEYSVAQCVDIGHLWKDGVDPVVYLNSCLHRTRVIHIHGIGERDHQSLAHMPTNQIDDVLNRLVCAPFTGVVTIEIFSESDLNSSLLAIQNSLTRLGFI